MSAQKLKETFNQKGQVTDVQLKYDKMRNFDILALLASKMMKKQIQTYFNNTFVVSYKIQVILSILPLLTVDYYSISCWKVEMCNLGESSKRKKAPEATPVPLLSQKVKPVKENTNKTPEDPEFAEFREIHS